MNCEMTNEIIELLPSADLKAKIKEIDHRFTEDDLLQIIYNYAPTFDTKLSMLRRFSNIASQDIGALARAYIEYEQDNFKRFTEGSNDFVYELCIKEDPDSYEEKYLCASYNAALVCIDRFYEEYAEINAKETEKTRYTIVKRRIFGENDKFDEDAYAECVLGTNKTVLEVSDFRNPADCDRDTLCSECKEICPRRSDDLFFPCFAHNYAIIKYLDHNLKECFGVCLCGGNCCDGFTDEFYVIPLDSPTIRERRFDDTLYDHEHIPAALATLALPEDLDEVTRENYFDFVNYQKSKEN